MPIKDYSTSISVNRTAAEIYEMLANGGAKAIIIEVGPDKLPIEIFFEVEVSGRTLTYRIPSHWQGVWYSLQNDNVEKRFKTPEQARKVAWRIIKDWIAAQLAIIEAGAARMHEVFMPYMITPNNKTMFEEFEANLLPSGETHEAV